MIKVKDAQFFTVVSSFLNVYLVKNRSCSSNTVKSYEDALNLLFTFLEGTKDIPRQRVNWSHFTRQNIQEFVDWLEKVRNCSRQTQLQRLAAIRSFVRYGGICKEIWRICTARLHIHSGTGTSPHAAAHTGNAPIPRRCSIGYGIRIPRPCAD